MKTTVAIIGAGRVGQAFLHILNDTWLSQEVDVMLLDTDEEQVLKIRDFYIGNARAVKVLPDMLHAALDKVNPHVVVCSTPFNVNITVATWAAVNRRHYIDFTEDVEVTKTIAALTPRDSTFIPQTGLAPGLVSYIGQFLADQLGDVQKLELRVGALPRYASAPSYYAVTWSELGLINEYINPAEVKRDGKIETVMPLTGHDELVIDGRKYEAFFTSGGVGMLEAYASIPSVDYKTLRYPGHLEYMRGFFTDTSNMAWEPGEKLVDVGVRLAKQRFAKTSQDVVVLLAQATCSTGKMEQAGYHFYGHPGLDLTALEVTTAGTGVAVLDLLLTGKLEKGILNSSQIPWSKLEKTGAMKLVMDQAR